MEEEVGSQQTAVSSKEPTPEWRPAVSEASRQSAVGSEQENSQPPIPNPQSLLLPLDAAERFVTLDVMGRKFKHFFRPATEKEWLEYERQLKPTITEESDGSTESRVGMMRATAELWWKLALRVEGYPFDDDPGWKDRVPLNHRGTAVLGLSQVELAEDVDTLNDSEHVVVGLMARWNGQNYPRLLHRFRRPSIEHELRFTEARRRFARRILKVGGERKPKGTRSQLVQIPNMPTLLELYAELMVEWEGYTGSPMDTWHKTVAVRGLFEGMGEASLEPIEEDDGR